MFDQQVLTWLRGWAMSLSSAVGSQVLGVYVFGSLINANGRAFSRSMSDIDLIIETDETDPLQRLMLLTQIAPYCDSLEDSLHKILGRKEGELITSTTLVTRFELDQGIHKDRNSRIFFASNSFVQLTQTTEDKIQIGNALSNDFLSDYFPAWTVIANTQKQRNKFLRKGISGGRSLREFDSSVYVLPKDLLRNAYAVDCLKRKRDPAFSDVDDTARGLSFIRNELEERAGQIPEATELLNLIESNRPGGKGDPLPVKPELLIYAWELIASSAQSVVMLFRADRALKRNKYAAKEVAQELVKYQATHLHCVDTAIELYRGNDIVINPIVEISVGRNYLPDLYEINKLDNNQLTQLIAEWPTDVQRILKERFGKEGSERSQCKVGFERLEYSARGVGETPRITIRPLTYWITRQFNKEIAIQKDFQKTRIRAEYMERLLCTAEDFHCECPSALYLEVAVITEDRRIPVIFKAAKQSALSVRAGTEIRTCGPEFGFIWARHVVASGGVFYLEVEKALHDALRDEFGVSPSEISSWHVGSFAIQSAHLNSALLGVVKVTLSETDLMQRLKKTKYHSDIEEFLSENQLFDKIQSDFGKGQWHATGLLRLTLAAQYLGVVS